MTSLCTIVNWKATISVNAVIGMHFIITGEHSISFIANEFLLVIIGIAIAILLNLFQSNQSHKKELIQHMRDSEGSLQKVLGEMAEYLSKHEMERNVWDDIIELEKRMHEYISEAYRYQDNTFHSHPSYYIDYFEMRLQQCGVLHNLHYEMKKIRTMPKQAEFVSQYILGLKEYVTEQNVPTRQVEELEGLFEKMKEEALPVTREEFEGRALLYHIMMDLEEFLVFKRRFIESIGEAQIERYWGKEV